MHAFADSAAARGCGLGWTECSCLTPATRVPHAVSHTVLLSAVLCVPPNNQQPQKVHLRHISSYFYCRCLNLAVQLFLAADALRSTLQRSGRSRRSVKWRSVPQRGTLACRHSTTQTQTRVGLPSYNTRAILDTEVGLVDKVGMNYA